MGVNGLWTLVSPVARPIKLETMGNKRLAIDSSIWLYQFQMAVRDKEGRALTNAHILGFLRRICKLLYYGIKPVFVFDGGAPALKRITIGERKQRKRGGQESLAKTAEKLLAAQMRQAAVKEAQKRTLAKDTGDLIDSNTKYLDDSTDFANINVVKRRRDTAAKRRPSPPAASTSQLTLDHEALPAPKKKKYVPRDEYALPHLHGSIEAAAKPSDPRLATEAELRDFIEDLKPEDFDMDSAIFTALPTELKYEIIGDLRVKSRQQNWKRVQEMRSAPTALDFSKAQIKNLMQRNDLTQKLLSVTDMVAKANLTIPVKIAAQRNREYVLVKNDAEAGGGWVLGIRDDVIAHDTRGSATRPVNVDGTTTEEGGTDTDEGSFEEVSLTAPEKLSSSPNRAGRGKLPAASAKSSINSDGDASDGPKHRTRRTVRVIQQRFAPNRTEDTALEEDEDFVGVGSSRLFRMEDEEDEETEVMKDILAEVQAYDLSQDQNTHPIASCSTPKVLEVIDSEEEVDFEEVLEPSKVAAGQPATGQEPRQIAEGSRPWFLEGRVSAVEAAVARDCDEESDGEWPETMPSSFRGPMQSREKMPSPSAQQISPQTDVCLAQKPKASHGIEPQASDFSEEPANRPGLTDLIARQTPATLFHAVASPQISKQALEGEIDPSLLEKQHRCPPTARPEPEPGTGSLPTRASPEARSLSPSQVERASPSAVQKETDTSGKGISLLTPLPDPNRPLSAEAAPVIACDPAQATQSPPAHAVRQDEVPQQGISNPSLQPRTAPAGSPIDDDEEVLPWSPSPSPVPRGSPKSPTKDSLEGFPLADPGHELSEGDEMPDEDEETAQNIQDEAKTWSNFLSELQNRNLDDLRAEVDNEVRELTEQRSKDRRGADDITLQMSKEIQVMLRLFGIPYVVAPMEAEAQCAELLSRSLVDGIITDDSDVFLFGGSRIYKNMFNQNKYVECYLLSDLERELSLDREKLVRLAYLLGSDYVDGLPGVGPVTAMEVMREFPGADGLVLFREWWKKVQTGQDSSVDNPTPFRRKFRKNKDRIYLAESWPNPAVLDAYYHPVVDESDQKFVWGIPDLDGLRQYLMEHLSWGSGKTDQLLVPLIMRQTQRLGGAAHTQGTLDAFFDITAGSGTYAPRQRTGYASARLQSIVKEWRAAQKSRAHASDAQPRESGEAVPEELIGKKQARVKPVVKKPPQGAGPSSGASAATQSAGPALEPIQAEQKGGGASAASKRPKPRKTAARGKAKRRTAGATTELDPVVVDAGEGDRVGGSRGAAATGRKRARVSYTYRPEGSASGQDASTSCNEAEDDWTEARGKRKNPSRVGGGSRGRGGKGK